MLQASLGSEERAGCARRRFGLPDACLLPDLRSPASPLLSAKGPAGQCTPRARPLSVFSRPREAP